MDAGEIDLRGRIVQLNQGLDDRRGGFAARIQLGRISHQLFERLDQVRRQGACFHLFDCRRSSSYGMIALVTQKRRQIALEIVLLGRLADGVDCRQGILGNQDFRHKAIMAVKSATYKAFSLSN